MHLMPLGIYRRESFTTQCPHPTRFGSINSACFFNGRNAFIEFVEDLDVDLSAFAIGFWAKSEGANPMVALSVAWENFALDFVSNAHAAMRIFENGEPTNSAIIGGPDKLTDGAWHFVFYKGSTRFKMYTSMASCILVSEYAILPLDQMPRSVSADH